MQLPLSCPVCGDKKLTEIKASHSITDGTLAYRCSKHHLFFVRKEDLENEKATAEKRSRFPAQW